MEYTREYNDSLTEVAYNKVGEEWGLYAYLPQGLALHHVVSCNYHYIPFY